MIHLTKSTSTKADGISLSRMACVNSPFIRGYIASQEEFMKAVRENRQVCKKCLAIAKKRHLL
jgi:hypothetical protein